MASDAQASTKKMPVEKAMRKSGFTIAMIALTQLSHVAFAQVDCATFPPGRERTDCYIIKGRLHGLQSKIAADKARAKTNASKLPNPDPDKTQRAPSR